MKATAPKIEDVAAEQTLLGSALIDAQFCEGAVERVALDHFYDPLHKRIMEAICELHNRGEKVTVLTIKARLAGDPGLRELSARPELRDHGGCYLTMLARAAGGYIGDPDPLVRRMREAKLTRDAATVIGFDALSDEIEEACCLSVSDWLNRDMPPLDKLMGEWLSTTSRAMLVACTGLGKTNVTMAMAFAMAAGTDFLHWRLIRPARVLFVDGEMSRRLVKIRLADAARRLGDIPANLFILCRDDVPEMPPLNTPEGQAFIDRTIEQLGGVDFVIFDNVMSLTSGDMKDEESWQQTLPWAKTLTKRSIGQLWNHHTGHDQTRSYGTSTREWQLDTVALLELVERPGADIAFSLKFTKARERSPHNRADFEPVVITLTTDQWTVETSDGVATAKRPKNPSPKAMTFHKALVGALVASGKARLESVNQPSVTMEEWEAECVRKGLINGAAKRNQINASMSKYRLELIASKWIAYSNGVVWNRTVAR